MSIQPQKPVKIWDRDRIVKKCFMSTGSFQSLIENANFAGIMGSKLILESDGTEIDSIEILDYFNQQNETFQLIDANSSWVPPPSTSTASSISYSSDSKSFSDALDLNSKNIITWIATDDVETVNKLHSPESSTSTTLSMSSGRITPIGSESPVNSDTIGIKQAEKLFSNYEFPISKISNETLELLNQGKPLENRLNDFVHCIVNDMRRKSFYIPQRVFHTISSRLIQLYPLSFAVVDGNGKHICAEPITLATKLCNHNNYMNRTSQNQTSTKSLKRKINMSDGVPNYFEKNIAENIMSEDEATKKRMWLKENYGREILNEELNNEIFLTFKTTFTNQRKFLNDNPAITQIIDQWPHLLTKKYLLQHFYELMEIEEAFYFKRWNALKIPILRLGTNSKSPSPLLQWQYTDDVNVLTIICSHFKENIDLMFKQYEFGCSLNEIEVPTATPWFAVIGK